MAGLTYTTDPRDRMPANVPVELRAKYAEIKAERERHQAELARLEGEYNRLYGQWQAHQPGAAERRKTQARLDQLKAEQEQWDQQAAAALARQNIDALAAQEAARKRRQEELERITGRKL